MQRNPESHSGTVGWALLAGLVVAWDLTQQESLTHAFERARTHQTGRVLALGAMAVTSLHLLDRIPHQFDPFYLALELKRERPVEIDG